MTAPRCACGSVGAIPPVAGGGVQVDVKMRHPAPGHAVSPLIGASTPSGATRSRPASTLLPSVMFVPSVIHPLLLNAYGASLPISVALDLEMTGAWVPSVGSIGPGDIGAGLS